MESETAPEQYVLSDELASPKQTEDPTASRRLAYKQVLIAAVVAVLTVAALGYFAVRQERASASPVPVAMTDATVEVASMTQAVPTTKVESVELPGNRRLEALSDRLDRGFEAQHAHSADIKHQLSEIAGSIATIHAAVAALQDTNQMLAERMTRAVLQLDTLTKNIRSLKAVQRKATVSPRAVKTPPFDIDAIDIWDDTPYVAVSQSGRVAFLEEGDQRSGWTVTRIDRLKGQVDLRGAAGQTQSVSLSR